MMELMKALMAGIAPVSKDLKQPDFPPAIIRRNWAADADPGMPGLVLNERMN